MRLPASQKLCKETFPSKSCQEWKTRGDQVGPVFQEVMIIISCFSVLGTPGGSLNGMFSDDAYPGENVQQMASKLKFRVMIFKVFGSRLVLRAGEILPTSVF